MIDIVWSKIGENNELANKFWDGLKREVDSPENTYFSGLAFEREPDIFDRGFHHFRSGGTHDFCNRFLQEHLAS